MSFYSMENDQNSVTRMDGPLSKTGPVARWQRKALESSTTCPSSSSSGNSSLNLSSSVAHRLNISARSKLNTSDTNRISNLSALTAVGTKRPNDSIRKTPSKTPKNSPGRDTITPGRKTPGGADRFIPSRAGTDFEKSRFMLLNKDCGDGNPETMSPSKREYRRRMEENLNGGNQENGRILSFNNKAPLAPDSHCNNLKVLYSQVRTPAKKPVRHIPHVPERILDAPEIVNDYYLNLLDWSGNNHLAVALGSQVYLWNAANGEIQQLLELEAPEDHVCSVKWIKEGNYLAVGTSLGEIELWNVENFKRVRLLSGHSDRVGALSWNQYVLSSGSRSGKIHHSDVRVANHHVSTLNGHTQEVCGLTWSPNGRHLASGGNDNLLNIWEVAQGERYTQSSPLYTFTQHQAAVKALAWCPWQSNVLASGGGTADRCIRIWNCNTGTLLNTVDTKSQVCALLWSGEYKELVSSHGFANNEITIWKYPAMVKTAELLGHTERVLHMALSPDGTTIVSAGADETLRLWKCFGPDPNRKKEETKTQKEKSNILRGKIR